MLVAWLAKPGRRQNPIAIRIQCVSVRRYTLTPSVGRLFDFVLPTCHGQLNSVHSGNDAKHIIYHAYCNVHMICMSIKCIGLTLILCVQRKYYDFETFTMMCERIIFTNWYTNSMNWHVQMHHGLNNPYFSKRVNL